ncbi:RNA polymerase sigma factor [Rhodoferax sp. BAB1]|uniref:RNA polymerase sigma factor n=1 Tax=Rhodoferax sp. BAB1 TaxID=2741720 RepID=UPI0015777425|nr:RNA polymerase sigma factor [Rhodoferax sp. BAB1]QKO20556.1 RNA polymerase sigma factor [Rhodoferax sp. BAB1]
MIDESDAVLVIQARRGERAAFDALVRRHWASVRQAARSFGIPETDVDDIVQDSFIAAWKALDDYDPTRPFRGWLFGIALNKMRDLLRFRKVRQFLFGASDISDDEAAGVPFDGPGPDKLAADRQELKRVTQTLDRLDRPLRDVLVLTGLVGMSQSEAAEALGVSLKTVEGRVIRARKRLKAILQQGHAIQK